MLPCLILSCERKLQRESSSPAHSLTLYTEFPAQLACRQGAAVQAKAMTFLPGSEPVVENQVQVFGWDANAIIYDQDFYPLAFVNDFNAQLLFRSSRFRAGIFGILNQVNQDLQHLVL